VFLYAPREEKIRRLRAAGTGQSEAEELVDTVDRERIAFIKHYFNADWPTRALYHLMINTTIGDEKVIATILDTMRLVEEKSAAGSGIRGVALK
jgi:cytidylate kinase